MYITYKHISPFSIPHILQISTIIKNCGVDMYKKYRLSHWKNSLLKTVLIIYYTILIKHTHLWAIYHKNTIIATFQTKHDGEYLNFSKFAVDPIESGHGIGSECLNIMEDIAKKEGLKGLSCEVFDKSSHALNFYLNRGFVNKGSRNTIKYTEYILVKQF